MSTPEDQPKSLGTPVQLGRRVTWISRGSSTPWHVVLQRFCRLLPCFATSHAYTQTLQAVGSENTSFIFSATMDKDEARRNQIPEILTLRSQHHTDLERERIGVPNASCPLLFYLLSQNGKTLARFVRSLAPDKYPKLRGEQTLFRVSKFSDRMLFSSFADINDYALIDEGFSFPAV
jgi:hypothetical protein